MSFRNVFASTMDPVRASELANDMMRENSRKARQLQIEAEMDKVWNEVYNGDHDSELFESVFVDTGNLTRIARIQALNTQLTYKLDPDVGAARDLYLQIEDYVRDVAERRVL